MAPLSLSMGTLTFEGVEAMKPALDAMKAAGITAIDTAEMYGGGDNEKDLGEAGAAHPPYNFIISTKSLGGWAKGHALQRENLLKNTDASLARLKVKQVDIFYIHGPDRSMKLEEWVPTVQEIYDAGKFKRFGVSNFHADEVKDLYAFCKAKSYVLPTVYQGNYNAVSRYIETDLFPVLRELGIAFYAYSPIAGGFLTKSRSALEAGTEGGRFAAGSGDGLKEMYRGMYMKPAMLQALDKWEALASEEGVSKAELAYRWVYYHSALDVSKGDVLIMGASRPTQITSGVEGLQKGALKESVAKGIEGIWEGLKHEAIVDNFDASQKDPSLIGG